eukprot:gb/GEZN01019287.1/.p1 GENE.gb/GEZN01019287.1/~~gb/GEZN01019287.1/.p1  ORF type:complete len:144 (+),score=1.50 gb/GEZN01019287.1/:284-715(+)
MAAPSLTDAAFREEVEESDQVPSSSSSSSSSLGLQSSSSSSSSPSSSSNSSALSQQAVPPAKSATRDFGNSINPTASQHTLCTHLVGSIDKLVSVIEKQNQSFHTWGIQDIQRRGEDDYYRWHYSTLVFFKIEGRVARIRPYY